MERKKHDLPSPDAMAAFLEVALRTVLGVDAAVSVLELERGQRYYQDPEAKTAPPWPKVRFPSLLDAAIVLDPALVSCGASAEGPGTLKPSDLERWGIPPETRCSVCGIDLNPAVAHPRPCGTAVGSCCAEKPEAGEVFETTHEYLHWILSFCDEHTDSCGHCEGCKMEAILRDRILALEVARS